MSTDEFTSNLLADFDLSLEAILLLGFYAVIGAYTDFTIMLYYHWQEYSVDDKVTKITIVLYFSLTLPLILALSLLTLYI